jgi:hypothetical protein
MRDQQPRVRASDNAAKPQRVRMGEPCEHGAVLGDGGGCHADRFRVLGEPDPGDIIEYVADRRRSRRSSGPAVGMQ